MPFCKIHDMKLYYEDYGRRNQVPLLFLHGLMSNSELWKPQVDHFKDHKRITILDLRGHGQSDKPVGRYSIKQFSEDLQLLMKNLEIEKAILAGHSMGGMTVLRFTLDHQEMVEKIILIDTTAKSSFSFRIELLLLISKILMSVSYKRFLRIYISRTLQKGYSKSELEKTLERVLKTPKHVTKSCWSAIEKFDVTPELANIRIPTLIIHGSESTTPLSLAKYMKEHIPNAELVIVEGAGHSTPKENPEEIWKAIERFI